MANTLTGLIPIVHEAMDTVSRELVGMIPSVSLSASAERAGLNQTIRAQVAPAATTGNITPGVTSPDDGDQTISFVDLTISNSKRSPVRWNGDEQASLDVPGGITQRKVQVDQFAQSFRALANLVEADLVALHILASRAAGTAGTTPFAFSATKSGFDDVALVRKELVDNGSPNNDMQLVLNTLAGAKMRSLPGLNSVADSADTTFLRQGILLPVHGMNIRETGQPMLHTKGTGASATTDTTGYAIGSTTITLASAGTGTILDGDVITFTGDANQYVVLTGDSSTADGGTIVLAAPGLRQAIPASATNITVVGNSNRSLAFHRNAIVLATRLPMRPKEGDLAIDSMVVTDERSGLSFEVSIYPQYRQIQYEIAIAWGVKVIKPAHVALLLG